MDLIDIVLKLAVYKKALPAVSQVPVVSFLHWTLILVAQKTPCFKTGYASLPTLLRKISGHEIASTAYTIQHPAQNTVSQAYLKLQLNLSITATLGTEERGRCRVVQTRVNVQLSAKKLKRGSCTEVTVVERSPLVDVRL